jgi:hypothetical protein
MATPHWDDISENHDPDRLVSNHCGHYYHPLIISLRWVITWPLFPPFSSSTSTHKHSSLWVASVRLCSNHLFTPCTWCCYRNIILSIWHMFFPPFPQYHMLYLYYAYFVRCPSCRCMFLFIS